MHSFSVRDFTVKPIHLLVGIALALCMGFVAMPAQVFAGPNDYGWSDDADSDGNGEEEVASFEEEAPVPAWDAFTVTGGTPDVDYKFLDRALIVLTDKPLTIATRESFTSNTSLSILVRCKGKTANLTLASGKHALPQGQIINNAGGTISLNLTVQGTWNLGSGIHTNGDISISGKGSLALGGPLSADGTLTLDGPSVYAAGSENKAAINGAKITVNAGEITAQGGKASAGLGGNAYQTGVEIAINGGEVHATGGRSFNGDPHGLGCGAGVGSGFKGSASVTIAGGKVHAKSEVGSPYAFAIGSGSSNAEACSVKISGGKIDTESIGVAAGENTTVGPAGTLSITGGMFTRGDEKGSKVASGIKVDKNHIVYRTSDKAYPYGVAADALGVSLVGEGLVEGTDYYVEDGQSVNITTTKPVTIVGRGKEVGSRIVIWGQQSGTSKVTLKDVQIKRPRNYLDGLNAPLLVRDGSVDLTLVGVNKFTSGGSAPCVEMSGSKVAIDGSGELRAVHGDSGTAIGWRDTKYIDPSDLTINGGKIHAEGTGGGAGIGGSGGSVTINGGTVYAKGSKSVYLGGCGIGYVAKEWDNPLEVTITGGSVTAIGAAGDEGGLRAAVGKDGGMGIAGKVTITGGEVNARGGYHGAGIGHLDGGFVRISGGVVKATGGDAASGIGGNHQQDCTDIHISGGTVTARGGLHGGCGIGAGGRYFNSRDTHVENSTITGGYINASITTCGPFHWLVCKSENDGVPLGIGGCGGTPKREGLTISGGYFSNGDVNKETVYGHKVETEISANPDSKTAKSYPFAVTIAPEITFNQSKTFDGKPLAPSDIVRSAKASGHDIAMSNFKIRYSSDNGATWSTTAPTDAGGYLLEVSVPSHVISGMPVRAYAQTVPFVIYQAPLAFHVEGDAAKPYDGNLNLPPLGTNKDGKINTLEVVLDDVPKGVDVRVASLENLHFTDARGGVKEVSIRAVLEGKDARNYRVGTFTTKVKTGIGKSEIEKQNIDYVPPTGTFDWYIWMYGPYKGEIMYRVNQGDLSYSLGGKWESRYVNAQLKYGAQTFAADDPALDPEVPVLEVSLTEEGKKHLKPGDPVGTFEIVAESPDYEPFTTSIDVRMPAADAKPQPVPSVAPEVSDITYGQKLADSVFTGGKMVDPQTGNEVAGTFAWADDIQVVHAGTYDVPWVFTPQDDAYDQVSGASSVTVRPREVNVTEVRVDSRPYDGTTEAEGAELALSGLLDGDEVSADGSYAWTSPDSGASTVAATDVSLIGEDAENYVLTGDLTQLPATDPETGEAASIVDAPFLLDNADQQAYIGAGLDDILITPHAYGAFDENDPSTDDDDEHEPIGGKLAWYTDAAHSKPLDDTYVMEGKDGSQLELYWTYGPSDGNDNYLEEPLSGSTVFTLQTPPEPVEFAFDDGPTPGDFDPNQPGGGDEAPAEPEGTTSQGEKIPATGDASVAVAVIALALACGVFLTGLALRKE